MLSDYEDVELPEFSLGTEPVNDSYSSDEDIENIKEDDRGPSQAKYSIQAIITYNGSAVTVKTLKKYFHLEFHTLPKTPTAEDLIELDVLQIVNYMINFVTNSKDNLTKELIGSFESFPESEIDVLCGNPQFHINLKEGRSEIPGCDHLSDPPSFKRACMVLRKIEDILALTSITGSSDTQEHHDRVKGCMTRLCELTTENVIINGECARHLESTIVSTKTNKPKTMSIIARPDILLTCSNNSYMFPGIPIEVYSSTKKQETPIRRVSNRKKHKIETESTDEEAKKSLRKFLSDNTPKYMFEKSRSCESRFKEKMDAQHVLQILSVASDYCFDKMCHKIPAKKSQVFIGLFVCDEYVYITKVQGDESCFVKYSTTYNKQIYTSKFRESIANPWFRLDNTQGVDQDPKLQVQFSNIVLDTSIHNHRIALLRFMQYYMYNWHGIKAKEVKTN